MTNACYQRTRPVTNRTAAPRQPRRGVIKKKMDGARRQGPRVNAISTALPDSQLRLGEVEGGGEESVGVEEKDETERQCVCG